MCKHEWQKYNDSFICAKCGLTRAVCNYCDTWEDNVCFIKTERKDWCSSIQIRHNKIVVRQNNREDWFNISFCPMCGKELEE